MLTVTKLSKPSFVSTGSWLDIGEFSSVSLLWGSFIYVCKWNLNTLYIYITLRLQNMYHQNENPFIITSLDIVFFHSDAYKVSIGTAQSSCDSFSKTVFPQMSLKKQYRCRLFFLPVVFVQRMSNTALDIMKVETINQLSLTQVAFL